MIDIDQPYSQPSALGVTIFLDKTRRTCQIRLAGPRSLVSLSHLVTSWWEDDLEIVSFLCWADIQTHGALCAIIDS